MKNLLADLPASLPEELVTVLAQNQHVRIERIVSTGHASPDSRSARVSDPAETSDRRSPAILETFGQPGGSVRDRPQRGEAELLFEGGGEPIHMKPGDHVLISAHKKHRVEWTTADEPTVWLAVFYNDE